MYEVRIASICQRSLPDLRSPNSLCLQRRSLVRCGDRETEYGRHNSIISLLRVKKLSIGRSSWPRILCQKVRIHTRSRPGSVLPPSPRNSELCDQRVTCTNQSPGSNSRGENMFVTHVWWAFVSVTKPHLFHWHQFPNMVWCLYNRARLRLGTNRSSVF